MNGHIDINFLIYLYEEFYHFFKDIKLSEISHHKENEDIFQLSKNHLEGNVWSHNCMVFRKFLELMENKKKLGINDIYTCIAVLCHDLGKYNTQGEKNNKITFYSHPFASIQYAVDFISYLVDKKVFIGDFIGDYPFYYILNPVSNHIDFLRSDFKKHELYCNYDADLAYINCLLCYCDTKGRITYNESNFQRTDEIKYTFNNRKSIFSPEDRYKSVEVIFLCGVPGCGKNTFKNMYYPRIPSISYDDIRIKIYREYLAQLSDDTPEVEYQNAFRYCQREKIDLNAEVNREFKRLIFQGYRTVIINNTNLSKRRRKSLIRLLGKNNYYRAVYVLRDTTSLIHANKTRTDKTIPSDVLRGFIFNQPMPTRQEGFDKIEFFNNCTQWR